MPRKQKNLIPKTSSEQKLIEYSRDFQVFKSSEMVQRGRMNLSLQEQRCVLFAISHIKPGDDVFQEYTINLKLFYEVFGLRDQSYTRLKELLVDLSSKTWVIPMASDPNTDCYVHWFSTLRTNKKSGIVTVKFHEDMMPYLLNLAENGAFYTHFALRFILPMTSQYSIQLYELLKSYQRNNIRWTFDIDELKKILCCTNYKNFKDFRRRVLEPATEEINKFGDFWVSYEAKKKGQGGRISEIEFVMRKKSHADIDKALYEGSVVLDGQGLKMPEPKEALFPDGDPLPPADQDTEKDPYDPYDPEQVSLF